MSDIDAQIADIKNDKLRELFQARKSVYRLTTIQGFQELVTIHTRALPESMQEAVDDLEDGDELSFDHPANFKNVSGFLSTAMDYKLVVKSVLGIQPTHDLGIIPADITAVTGYAVSVNSYIDPLKIDQPIIAEVSKPSAKDAMYYLSDNHPLTYLSNTHLWLSSSGRTVYESLLHKNSDVSFVRVNEASLKWGETTYNIIVKIRNTSSSGLEKTRSDEIYVNQTVVGNAPIGKISDIMAYIVDTGLYIVAMYKTSDVTRPHTLAIFDISAGTKVEHYSDTGVFVRFNDDQGGIGLINPRGVTTTAKYVQIKDGAIDDARIFDQPKKAITTTWSVMGIDKASP